MDATDVYVIESDIQKSLEHTTVTRLCGVTQESWDYGGIFYSNWYEKNTCPQRKTNIIVLFPLFVLETQ